MWLCQSKRHGQWVIPLTPKDILSRDLENAIVYIFSRDKVGKQDVLKIQLHRGEIWIKPHIAKGKNTTTWAYEEGRLPDVLHTPIRLFSYSKNLTKTVPNWTHCTYLSECLCTFNFTGSLYVMKNPVLCFSTMNPCPTSVDEKKLHIFCESLHDYSSFVGDALYKCQFTTKVKCHTHISLPGLVYNLLQYAKITVQMLKERSVFSSVLL